MNLRVVAPGSTSNLGAGFDTLSAALSLYLRIDVHVGSGSGFTWPEGWDLPEDQNAIAQALRRTAAETGLKLPALRFEVDSEIPLKRGLGSSGAAIVAGIKLAESLSGRAFTTAEILELAYPLEGHPDNLAASLLGGWVVSRVENGRMQAERLPSQLSLRFVAAIPEQPVSTSEARAILPAQYSREDAVFNLQRCALMVLAVTQGRPDLLAEATRDRIHQDYRASLVPGAPAILARQDLPASLQASVLAVTVSGSGSSLLALAEDAPDAVGAWMVRVLAEAGTAATFRVLDLDVRGARVL
jgi:homoserine kinase